MKKINDTRLYFYFSIITLAVALILGLVAGYSMFRVEPKVSAYLAAEEGVADTYANAYRMLRNPQVFARYENFDAMAMPVKSILRDYDKKMYAGEPFTRDDKIYLEILLERRMSGSGLTRNTAVFFALLSLLGWGFYFFERRSVKNMA